MTLKNLLMISYYFPPLGGAGTLRSVKLARYLPDFGWRPVVLSVKNPEWYYAHDPKLFNELPNTTKVYRSWMIPSTWIYRLINPFRSKTIDQWIRRTIIQPDDQVGWIPSGIRAGLNIVERENIQAVYSTSAPMSAHLIAYLIKRKTGIAWIADFRDEWYENPDFYYPTQLHKRLHLALEQRVVTAADHVIAAAPGFCRLLAKHPDGAKKCTTVYMGFDLADFNADGAAHAWRREDDRFTIAFSGLFYGSFRPSRFFSAVSGLIANGKIDPYKLRIIFIGPNIPADTGFIDEFDICRFTGFISHQDSVNILKQSDVLLLLLSRERGDFVVPSKTFEYIAAQKPILALVPKNSEVASVINTTRTGIVVDFEDEAGIWLAVHRLYLQWLNRDVSYNPNRVAVSIFDQRYQTARFVELLNHSSSDNQTCQT